MKAVSKQSSDFWINLWIFTISEVKPNAIILKSLPQQQTHCGCATRSAQGPECAHPAFNSPRSVCCDACWGALMCGDACKWIFSASGLSEEEASRDLTQKLLKFRLVVAGDYSVLLYRGKLTLPAFCFCSAPKWALPHSSVKHCFTFEMRHFQWHCCVAVSTLWSFVTGEEGNCQEECLAINVIVVNKPSLFYFF
jgi:hypothetical protein